MDSNSSMDLIPCSRRRLDSNSTEISDSALNRLSNDVLIDILARLPCVSATRSKLVCKRWYSLISSDYFVKPFTNFNYPYSDPFSYYLIFQFMNRYNEYEHTLLVHCESSTNRAVQMLDLGFLPCRSVSRIAVRASCADLILCSFMVNCLSSEENLYVCNPRTKQWVALPPAPTRMDVYLAGLLCIPAPCSLCPTRAVDSTRCKFMVMRIRCYNTGFSRLEVELFSSEEGQWRNHFLFFPLKSDPKRGNIVPYKGMLRWVSYPYVLVFDPFNAPGEISRVINIKPDTIPSRIHNIGVCFGRLRISYSSYGSDYAHILELEDYDTGKWSLVHKWNTVDSSSICEYVNPDGNVVTKVLSNSSIWLSNLVTTKEAIDLKYELLVPYGRGLYLDGMNVHHIDDKCWPTPVPSLKFR